MKRLNVKKWLWILGIVMAAGLVAVLGFGSGGEADFRVAIVNEEGIFLRTISPSRKMVNLLDVDKEVMVWIPKGYGWYKSGTVGKLLTRESKTELLPEVFYYNFGFVPEVVLQGKTDGWFYNWRVISQWGIRNYLRFRIFEESMMTKRETVGTELQAVTDFLNNVLPRDFADSEVLNSELRLSVLNQSQEGGLAAFVARNLEWGGYTVVGVDNYTGNVDVCQINYGERVDTDPAFEKLKRIFPECKANKSNGVNEDEVEITLGDGFAKMLNYQSYRNN